MKIISLYMVFVFALSSAAQAQNKVKIDSLLKLLQNTKQDTKRVNTLNLIGWEYVPDTTHTLAYATKAYNLAQQIKYPKGIADSYRLQGWMARIKGRHHQAINLFQKSLRLSQKHDYGKGKAAAYNCLGTVYGVQAKYEQAIKCYKKSLEINQQYQLSKQMASGYNNLGNVYFSQGNYTKALECYQKVLAIDEKGNNKAGLAFDYTNLGNVYSVQGKYAKALKYYHMSLAIEQENNNKFAIAGCYQNIGAIYQNQGNYPAAIEYFQKALEIEQGIGSKQGLSVTYGNLGEVYTQLTNYDLALEYHHKALRIDSLLGNKQGVALSYNNIGSVYKRQHKYEKAMAYYQESLKIFKEIGAQSGIAQNYLSLGSLALWGKHYAMAQEHLEQALGIWQKLGEEDMVPSCLVELGKVHFLQKNYAKAVAYLEQGMEKARKIKLSTVLKTGAETLAKTYRSLGKSALAYDYYVLFKQMSDSLMNIENAKKITRLEDEFEFRQEKDSLKRANAKQAHQLKEEQDASRFQSRVNVIIIVLLVIVVALALATYRNELRQRKLNGLLQDQKENLEDQQHELSTLNEELLQSQEEISMQSDAVAKQNKLLSEHKNRIDQSFRAARVIQRSILPSRELMSELFAEHLVLYMPKDVVSGDFYWLHQTHEHVILVVADCTGHGVPGAFMTLIGNTLLDKLIKIDKITDPAEVLSQLHIDIQVTLRQKETQYYEGGMDAIMLTISKTKTSEGVAIQVAGAKTDLIYVNPHTEQMHILKGVRKSLGGLQSERKQFVTEHLVLPKGSLLYAGSDGLTDQANEAGEKFGRERLRDFVQQNWQQPLSHQKAILQSCINKYTKNVPLRDDILWLGVKI